MDTNDVVENEVLSQIARVNSLIQSYSSFESITPSISFMIASLRTLRVKLEKKLQKLYAFNQKSPSFFNEIDYLLSQVETGITEISSGRAWNTNTNTFSIREINMDWSNNLNNRWEQKVQELEQDAIEYMNELERKLPDVTEDDLRKLFSMTKHCLDVEVPETLLEFLIRKGPEYAERFEEEFKSATISSSLGTVLEASGSQVKNIAQLISYYAATWGPNGPNSFVMMSTEAANRTRQAVAIGETVSKFGKVGVPVVGGLIDFGSQVIQGENVGDAAIKAGAHVAIGLAGGKAGAAIGTAIGTAIFPGAGTAAGAALGFVIGVGITAIGVTAFDFLYDNREEIYESVKATINSVGETINNIGNEIGEGFKNVGNAVSGFFNGLGSAFG